MRHGTDIADTKGLPRYEDGPMPEILVLYYSRGGSVARLARLLMKLPAPQAAA